VCTGFRLGNLREGDHLEDLGLDGIFKKWGGGCMDWIVLAQDRVRCQALVNAILNPRVS
jgi:hypothetical protein